MLMKKIIAVFALGFIVLGAFAKKDINAWKQEKTLPQQYEVFKMNLNYWNGSYFLKEHQLYDFYSALSDSIDNLENNVENRNTQIRNLKSELNSRDERINNLQQDLDESLKLQNSIILFGTEINKNVYSITMYLIIAGVLALAGFVFLLYKRSLVVLHRTKKDYDELKVEYDAHKKNALERYTKINMELHKTRLELKKK